MDNRDRGKIPIYRALVQPNLFMGAERTLMLFSVFVCVLLMFFALLSLSVWQFVMAVVFWLFLTGILRAMGAKDPHMSAVYQRHQKYSKYYPPYDSVWRNH